MTENTKTAETIRRQQKEQKFKQSLQKSQKVFKSLLALQIVGFLFAVGNITKFREQSQPIEHTVIPYQIVAIGSTIGFVFHLITRFLFQQTFTPLMRNKLNSRHNQCPQKDKQIKSKSYSRQFYQFWYHAILATIFYALFRQQSWLPSIMGGQGSCQTFFVNFPNWPDSDQIKATEYFCSFLLGSSFFRIFQLFIIKRQFYKDYNFYELAFHHFTEFSILLLSMFYNWSTVVIFSSFLYDISESFRAINKVFLQTKYSEKYAFLFKITDYCYIAVWILLRIFVYSLCSIQANFDYVAPVDYSYLKYQECYIIGLSCLILFLQSYWAFFLVNNRISRNKYQKQLRQWETNMAKTNNDLPNIKDKKRE